MKNYRLVVYTVGDYHRDKIKEVFSIEFQSINNSIGSTLFHSFGFSSKKGFGYSVQEVE